MKLVDEELEVVKKQLLSIDSTGEKFSAVLRDTIDQLYDGQRTGRYRWDQLHKTEKTHCGTLVEINLHRAFAFDDGTTLDYSIAGIEVDCKYSQSFGGWTIPPEALDKLCLVVTADDAKARWSVGLVRIDESRLNIGRNRDRKATLNQLGRSAIAWLFKDAELPPNVLLRLPENEVARIFGHKHGTSRVNELFRTAQQLRVGRGVVATVAQQDDYMKRVRYNGGARSALRPEGIVILGQFKSHQSIARTLGVPIPLRGESVSVRVVRDDNGVEIDANRWRIATQEDPVMTAPMLPER